MGAGERMRFGIAATYDCDQACRYCNRGIDVIPWSQPSNIDIRSVIEAGRLIEKKGMIPNKVRVTGGEPTLHAGLLDLCRAVEKHWKPQRCIVVMTNHRIQGPDLKGINARYSWASPMTKEEQHRPWMISPADLGLDPVHGFTPDRECWVQRGCGRLFDAFGFSFCVLAGAVGRLLRIDPYSRDPVLNGREDICRHCICSLPRKEQWRVWAEAGIGQVEEITRTYRDGIERYKSDPFLFKRWEERSG